MCGILVGDVQDAFNIATSRNINKKYLLNYLLNESDTDGIEMSEQHIIRWDGKGDFYFDEAIEEYERNIIIKAVKSYKKFIGSSQEAGHFQTEPKLQAK